VQLLFHPAPRPALQLAQRLPLHDQLQPGAYPILTHNANTPHHRPRISLFKSQTPTCAGTASPLHNAQRVHRTPESTQRAACTVIKTLPFSAKLSHSNVYSSQVCPLAVQPQVAHTGRTQGAHQLVQAKALSTGRDIPQLPTANRPTSWQQQYRCCPLTIAMHHVHFRTTCPTHPTFKHGVLS
jgi:hypothetical protein